MIPCFFVKIPWDFDDDGILGLYYTPIIRFSTIVFKRIYGEWSRRAWNKAYMASMAGTITPRAIVKMEGSHTQISSMIMDIR